MAIRYLKQEEVDVLTAEKVVDVVKELDEAADELSSVIEDSVADSDTTEDTAPEAEVVLQKAPVPSQNTLKHNSKKRKR